MLQIRHKVALLLNSTTNFFVGRRAVCFPTWFFSPWAQVKGRILLIFFLRFSFHFSINIQVNCVSSHTCLVSVHVAIITDCSDNRNLFSWPNISTRHSAQTGYAENRLLSLCAHLYSHWGARERERQRVQQSVVSENEEMKKKKTENIHAVPKRKS